MEFTGAPLLALPPNIRPGCKDYLGQKQSVSGLNYITIVNYDHVSDAPTCGVTYERN